jgi:microcystin degradation protein MlrC
MSVVATVRQEDAAAGQTAVEALADGIWQRREGYRYDSEPLADSLARAKAMAAGQDKPILLLDHGDNCMSGGTCDTMDVLQEALAQGMAGIAVGPVCDPQAVAELVAAGVGAEVEIALGNKVPLELIGRQARPLQLRGTVRAVSDGWYTVTGPIYRGQRFHMGRTVCLDTGAARIVVTEQTQEPWDLAVFTCVGIDPTQATYVLLKSRMYCRPVFVPLSGGLVECDSAGVTTADFGRFPYTNIQRPVFPFDRL